MAETYVTDWFVVPGAAGSRNYFGTFRILRLRPEQVKIIDDHRQKKVPVDMGALGWVPPDDIAEYYCPKCDVVYDEPPKLELYVGDKMILDDVIALGGLNCNHCNKFLGSEHLHEEDKRYVEKWKEHITQDDSGKIIPYTPEFIDERLEHKRSFFQKCPRTLYEFYGDTNKWIERGKSIGHEVSPNKIYRKVWEEPLRECISDLKYEDMMDFPLYKKFVMLNEIIESQHSKPELKRLLRKRAKACRKSLGRALFNEEIESAIEASKEFRPITMSKYEKEILHELLRLRSLEI